MTNIHKNYRVDNHWLVSEITDLKINKENTSAQQQQVVGQTSKRCRSHARVYNACRQAKNGTSTAILRHVNGENWPRSSTTHTRGDMGSNTSVSHRLKAYSHLRHRLRYVSDATRSVRGNCLKEVKYTGWQWRNFFISAVFRHFVGQALRNVWCSDVSRRHFLNKIATVRTFS